MYGPAWRPHAFLGCIGGSAEEARRGREVGFELPTVSGRSLA